jgi:two-component system, cell cycle sensor histidine kinase and response regulator CckA
MLFRHLTRRRTRARYINPAIIPPLDDGPTAEHPADRLRLVARAPLMDTPPPFPGRTVVDLNEVVQQTVATLPGFHEDGIRLRLSLWMQVVGVVAARGALERVLLNLVLNACDAMPDGGLLTIETAVTHGGWGPIDRTRPGPYARLRITDSGCGMNAAVKARMFDAFFTTKKNGTGLGLRSVAFTIDQLGGTISVESEPRRGTTVTLLLPLAPGPPA